MRTALGSRAAALACDVRDPAAPERALAEARRLWGRVDALVNNAGVLGPMQPFAVADAAEWEAAIDVNLLAPSRFMRALVAARDPDRLLRIVNIGSGAASRPFRAWSAYCTSKAGLAMLTRCAALELADQNVRCFDLIPGLIDTAMQARIRAEDVNEVSRLPKDALRPAAEPAKAACYLLSGEADDLAGAGIDFRDPSFRSRVGLPPL